MVKTAFSGQSDRRKRRIDLSHESEICDHNLLLVRSLSFLTGLNFYGAIFGVAMNEALGSVVSVGMVVSAKALATVISEIPSGILADVIGRKFTLLLATIFRLISCATLVFAATLPHYIFSAVCSGFADAMVSGTDQALIFDSLKAARRENEFKQSLAKANFLWPAAACIASVGGGFLADLGGLPLAALVTCLALLAALFCSLKLIEPARGGSSLNLRRSSSAISAQSRTGMTGVAYAGWRHIVHTTKDFRHDKRLMVVLLFSSLTFAFSETVHNLKGVFLLDRGVRLASQGWWTAISFALSSAGSLYANELSNRLGDIGTLALCNVMSGLSMLAATYAPPQYSALLLMSGSFMWGVQWPVSSHLLNSCTLSHRRATIISVVSLVKKLGLAMCAPGLSLIVDTFCDKSNTILLAFQAASVLLMFIPVVLLLYPEEQSATALAQSFEDLMDDLHNSNPSISGETTMATVLSENILSDERLLSPNDGNETKKTR